MSLGTVTRLLGALVLAGLFCTPAAAQISIKVVDSDGRPIPAVQVDLHGRAELIDSEATSALGIAELGPDRWSEVRFIRLSHLAYRTRIVQADDLPADRVIRLVWEAIEIEGIDVTGTEPCPIADDPEARRLWADVASHYSQETGSRALSAYFSRYGGDGLREGELHLDPDGLPRGIVFASGPGVFHAIEHVAVSLEERVETEGYAWPPLRINGVSTGRYGDWEYPELDRSHAYHFASRSFGAVHNFEKAGESDGQITLTFCGNRNARGATMNGTITLVPGEALISAEWRFKTSDPDERAGGSVTLATYVEAPGRPPHLVASRGLFYRRTGPAPEKQDLPTYGRQISTDQRWYVHPSADHPCNTGYSIHGNPPTTPEAVRFGACITSHWGRQ
jgi:hypothetical protein